VYTEKATPIKNRIPCVDDDIIGSEVRGEVFCKNTATQSLTITAP